MEFRLYFLVVCISLVTAYTREKQCKLGEVPINNVIPRGGFKVDHIVELGEINSETVTEDCLWKCCKLGHQNCQYIWIIWNQCFAISCNAESNACDSVELPFSTINSIYISMYTPPTEEREGVTSSPNWTGENSNVVDLPPVANAGMDVTIHLPNNTVTLNGNKSTDDKGITNYLWQLTSEDHLDQATLINPTLPLLHVINLTPGTYTFTLTVVDDQLQMNKDTVKVHVLPALTTEVQTTEVETTKVETTNDDTSVWNANATAVSVVFYSNKSNLLKVLVPVLLFVAVILIVSAAIVGISFCLCDRKKHMKHIYSYRRLPETIEKT